MLSRRRLPGRIGFLSYPTIRLRLLFRCRALPPAGFAHAFRFPRPHQYLTFDFLDRNQRWSTSGCGKTHRCCWLGPIAILTLGSPSHPESKGPGEVAALPGGARDFAVFWKRLDRRGGSHQAARVVEALTDRSRRTWRRQRVVAVNMGKKIRRRFPHIIEITIPPLGLDPQTSREIVDFHRSRNIQVRFGHAIKNVCRWCFSEAATAEAFKEQFRGNYVVKSKKNTARRTIPKIIAAAFISDSITYLMSSGAELAAQFGLI
jgi:hypothetical protein